MDNLLVSDPANIRYLTEFSGTYAFLLLLDGQRYLFTDSRYFEKAHKEVRGVNIRLIKDDWPLILSRYNIKRLGFEANSVSFRDYSEWRKKLKKIKFIPTKDIIEKERQIKTSREVSAIRKAIGITEDVLARLRIKPGITESELSKKIESQIRLSFGAEPAFPAITAFGSNSSMPHAFPGRRKLANNQIVLIDFGTKINGYSSDLTRTFRVGRITKKFRKIYNIVLDAQRLAIEGIKPGRPICEIDCLARNYIKKNGFGRYFVHALGHGIGLQVHELPRINSRNKEKLEEGMIFSVEPGIYIPGWGGVRIEDLVVVTKNGCEALTTSPKKLDDMVI